MSKKFLALLLLIAAAVPVFQSCSSSSVRKGEIYLVSGAFEDGQNAINWGDCFNELQILVDKDLCYDEQIVTERTITVDDRQYIGEFDGIRDGAWPTYTPLERYVGEAGLFSIDHNTGKLADFGKKRVETESSGEAFVIDKETGRAAAERFLSGITDLKNMDCVSTKIIDLFNERSYKFKRTIDGIDTAEWAEVHVNSKGEITHYLSAHIGSFEKYELPSDFRPDEAKAKAEEKLNSIIAFSCDNSYRGHSLKNNKSLLVKWDGRCLYCMEYSVEIDFIGRTQDSVLELYYAVD